jgi:hypothetical protein
MWLPLLFSASVSLLDQMDTLLPEPILLIPISVVLIGNHSFSNRNQTIICRKWFQDLSHVMSQEIQQSTDWYISSDKIHVPRLRYRLNFSFVDIREDDHIIFERALTQLSRISDLSSKTSVIHPYPLGLLLQSLVDHYRIPNYVFFLFASKTKHFSFCEGLHSSETSIVNASEVRRLELNKSRSWGSEISSLLKSRSLLGNWSTSGAVRFHLQTIRSLTCELKNHATKKQCGRFWALQNRILWADASSFVRNSRSDQTVGQDEPNDADVLADTEASYAQLCTNNTEASSKFCTDLENYIEFLRESRPRNEDRSLYLRQFLVNVSAVIIDAVKAVIVPDVPPFVTPLADTVIFKVRTITDPAARQPPLTKLCDALKSYLPNSTIAIFDPIISNLTDFPFLALEFSRFEESGKFRGASAIREGLQLAPDGDESPKTAGLLTRVIPIALAVYDGPLLLLFNNDSPSFAFDSVSFAVTNSTAFDPLPILRSCLVHLYGLPPARRWRSLSVLCVSSCHSELSAISRDAAHRNMARVELLKASRKVVSRVSEAEQLLHFAGANWSVWRFDELLRAQIGEVRHLVDEVTAAAAALHFERLASAARALRNARGTFSKQTKALLRELQEQVCEYAPVNAIVKRPSIADQLDRIAVASAFLWIGGLAVSSVVLMLAIARNLKRD